MAGRSSVPTSSPRGGRTADLGGGTRRALTVVTVVLILATTSTGIWVVAHWRTDPYTRDDALAAYRAATSNDAAMRMPPVSSTRASSTPVSTSAPGPWTSAADAESTATADTSSPTTADSTDQSLASTTTTPEPGSPSVRELPVFGVYEYASDGFARINGTALRHDYPERTYAVAQGGDGACEWSLDHRPVDQVVDVLSLCSNDESVTLLAWRLSRTFVGVTMSFDLTCQPPPTLTTRAAQEATVAVSCATGDGKTAVDGTLTISPRHNEMVGDQSVPVQDARAQLSFHGDFNGSAIYDITVQADTGLKISEHRLIDSTGAANYREEATFTLISLTPVT